MAYLFGDEQHRHVTVAGPGEGHAPLGLAGWEVLVGASEGAMQADALLTLIGGRDDSNDSSDSNGN